MPWLDPAHGTEYILEMTSNSRLRPLLDGEEFREDEGAALLDSCMGLPCPLNLCTNLLLEGPALAKTYF